MQETSSQKPWVNKLMKMEHALCVLINWVSTAILIAMLADMVWQVVCRFILKLSVPWTDELARYLWISITYIGAGAAVSENNHIEISLVASVLRVVKDEKKKRVLAQIDDLIRFAALFCLAGVILRLSWPYMLKVRSIGQLSAAMHMPSWILAAVLVFGLASIMLHCLFRIIISVSDHGAIIDPIIVQGKEDAP